MTGPAVLAGAVAGLAVLVLLLPRGVAAAARLQAVVPQQSEDPRAGGPPGSPAARDPLEPVPADRPARPSRRAGLLPAVLAAAGAAALLPPALAPVALPVGLAVHRLALRREPAVVRSDRLRAERDLPPALDLLAACLAAGASIGEALGAVGTVTSPPLRRPLLEAAAALDLGSPADQALAAWDREPALDGLGPALAAAVGGGTPLAGAVRRLADDRRARAAAAGLAAARRVGVQVVLPLGVCFLPSFVLVGVVPVVAGVAGRITP